MARIQDQNPVFITNRRVAMPPAAAKGRYTDRRNSGPMPEKDPARERLGRWFLSLTPQERLALAEETEEFRREARLASASGDNEDAE